MGLLFQINAEGDIGINALLKRKFGFPLRGGLIRRQRRRVNTQLTLYHQSAPLGHRPVFAQPYLYILHGEIPLVEGVTTLPWRDTDSSVEAQSERQGLGVADLRVGRIRPHGIARCVHVTVRSGYSCRPENTQRQFVAHCPADIQLQSVTLIRVVAEIEEPRVEIMDVEQEDIESPSPESEL